MRKRPDVMINIDSVEEITDRGVCVVLQRSGKRAWLPIRELDFLPGAIVAPEWLARKLLRGDVVERGVNG